MKQLDEIIDIFAERLTDLIREKGWTIAEFSKKIGIPRTTIKGWTLKIKSPKIDNLCAVADFFGVTTDYLLGREY